MHAVPAHTTTITVRNLDEAVKRRLRVRAAQNGRSMEAEVREILSETLLGPDWSATPLGSRIRARFAGLGGEALGLPERSELPRAADLGA